MRTLGLSRDEAKALGMSCHQVMGYGIGCGYGKNNPDLLLLYTGALTKMTMGYPDMSEAGLRPATVLGDHYANALGCGSKMKQMTDTAAAILRN